MSTCLSNEDYSFTPFFITSSLWLRLYIHRYFRKNTYIFAAFLEPQNLYSNKDKPQDFSWIDRPTKKRMEFYAYPSRALPSSSSVSNFSIGDLVERVKYCFSFAVSTIVGNVFSAIFTFFFALGGYYFCISYDFCPKLCNPIDGVQFCSGKFCSTISNLVEFLLWVEIRV